MVQPFKGRLKSSPVSSPWPLLHANSHFCQFTPTPYRPTALLLFRKPPFGLPSAHLMSRRLRLASFGLEALSDSKNWEWNPARNWQWNRDRDWVWAWNHIWDWNWGSDWGWDWNWDWDWDFGRVIGNIIPGYRYSASETQSTLFPLFHPYLDRNLHTTHSVNLSPIFSPPSPSRTISCPSAEYLQKLILTIRLSNSLPRHPPNQHSPLQQHPALHSNEHSAPFPLPAPRHRPSSHSDHPSRHHKR